MLVTLAKENVKIQTLYSPLFSSYKPECNRQMDGYSALRNVNSYRKSCKKENKKCKQYF